jgi:hypothetical protein
MRLPVCLSIAAAAFIWIQGPIHAADIARLEWGAFVVEDDSSGGYQEVKTSVSDDGRAILLKFASLEAKADGSTLEGRSAVSGRYEVFQPVADPFTSCSVEVEGHVIKSAGSVARLVLTIGGQEQVIEWPAGQALSEKFRKTVDVAMPAGGRLPNPFVVGVEAYARKDGAADASYVSVDTIRVTAQHPQIASR